MVRGGSQAYLIEIRRPGMVLNLPVAGENVGPPDTPRSQIGQMTRIEPWNAAIRGVQGLTEETQYPRKKTVVLVKLSESRSEPNPPITTVKLNARLNGHDKSLRLREESSVQEKSRRLSKRLNVQEGKHRLSERMTAPGRTYELKEVTNAHGRKLARDGVMSQKKLNRPARVGKELNHLVVRIERKPRALLRETKPLKRQSLRKKQMVRRGTIVLKGKKDVVRTGTAAPDAVP